MIEIQKIDKKRVIKILNKNTKDMTIDEGGYIYIEDKIDFIFNSLIDSYIMGTKNNTGYIKSKDDNNENSLSAIAPKIESIFDCHIDLQDIDGKGENFVVHIESIKLAIIESFNMGLNEIKNKNQKQTFKA